MIYCIKNCVVCGNEFPITQKNRVDTAKYCSKKCMGSTQKGRKNPHSKEWEEKRLAAVRANTYKYKGVARPESKRTIKIAVEALNKKRKEDPDKYAKKSIANLPKNVSGEMNGNFKDWATKKSTLFRVQNSSKFSKWRKDVLDRDGNKCRMCGSPGKLDAHHIIALSETTLTAFLVMNGVSLCRKCHVKTDSFGAKSFNKTPMDDGIGVMTCLARTIPHRFQAYETVGNYEWTESGLLVIFVSDLGSEEYEKLVFIHEYIEANLCLRKGIKESDITNFDLMFEKERELGMHQNFEEPGDDHRSPYREQHIFATKIEKMLAHESGINWEDYESKINSL